MSHDYIELVDYDSDWPQKAVDEIMHLRELLPPESILDIQHVGSTAIPGMIAKPIIDIQIAVLSLIHAKEIMIKRLEADHFVYWYDNPDTDRMFFVKGMPPYGKKRTHHLHIVEKSNHHWIEKIMFRDLLVKDADMAAQYAELKRWLAKEHKEDREMYTESKTAFIKRVLNHD